MPLSNQRKVQLLHKIYDELQTALLKKDMQRIKTLMNRKSRLYNYERRLYNDT